MVMPNKATQRRRAVLSSKRFWLFVIGGVCTTVILRRDYDVIFKLNVESMVSSVDGQVSNRGIGSDQISIFDTAAPAPATATATYAKVPFRDDMLKDQNVYGVEGVWDSLIALGAESMQKNNYSQPHLVTFEVGAHRAKQSLSAAKAQFHTHLFEPSPPSFHFIKVKMRDLVTENPELEDYIHLHNVAVGSTTGDLLNFTSTGRTGDHVGEFDTWNMRPFKRKNKNLPARKRKFTVQVPTMKLDDLIYHHSIESENPIDEVYVVKIDTQGFEPHVFAGLKESIKNHKIKYLLTEYWPNGMALINNRTDKCNLAMETLEPLISAGYSIYALPIVAHASIKEVKKIDWKERPFDDLRADCEYMLDLEKRFPREDYHMGYWTDYFFVAPETPPLVI